MKYLKYCGLVLVLLIPFQNCGKPSPATLSDIQDLENDMLFMEDLAEDIDLNEEEGELEAQQKDEVKESEGAESSNTDAKISVLDYIKIHLSYKGNDKNDGSTRALAIKTFGRAQDLVKSYLRHKKDIRILIRPGVYKNTFITWSSRLTMPNNKIIFMPDVSDYKFNNKNFVHFKVTNGVKSNFFNLVNKTGRTTATNLVFYHLKIENYFNGIVFSGKTFKKGEYTGYTDVPGAVTHNQIIDCRFYKIGSRHFSGDKPAYKAIGFNNSDHNIVRYNHFNYVENKASKGVSLIHGIYAAHNSSNNDIYFNLFERNSGHPIKFRDFSNYNTVKGNIFIYSGSTAMVQDWYLSTKVKEGKARYKKNGYLECPSWENIVLYNYYNKSYYNLNNLTDKPRQAIPITIVERDDKHKNCEHLWQYRMRAWSGSNYRRTDPSHLRSLTQSWKSLKENWVDRFFDL